jgi:hypothetical protein
MQSNAMKPDITPAGQQEELLKKARAINQTARRPSGVNAYLKAATRDLDGVQPVVVVDVHMRFGSMVMFMIKWSVASIPAFLILFVMGWIATRIFGGLLIALS